MTIGRERDRLFARGPLDEARRYDHEPRLLRAIAGGR